MLRVRLKLLLASGVAAACVVALSASTAYACSCGLTTPVAAFRKSSAVFVGTLAAIRETTVAGIDSPRRTEGDSPWALRETPILVLAFQIDEPLKGTASATIEVVTDAPVSSCYAGFAAGRRYLVYADAWTRVPEDVSSDPAMPAAMLERLKSVNGALPDLATGLCTRSGSLEDRRDELEIIRSLKDGRAETRIYGSVRRSEWDFEKGYYATTDAGPMVGVLVTATGPGGRFETTTDGEGRYRFANLPGGEYAIVPVFPKTYSPSRAIRVEVTPESGGGSAYFSTSTNGRVAGRLFENGRYVASEVGITLLAIGPDGYPTGVGVNAFTRQGGAFAFERIPAGRYVIGINVSRFGEVSSPYPPTYHPGVEDPTQAHVIELEAGQAITVDVSLPARLSERTITGVVVWTDGTPVADAYVELTDVTKARLKTSLGSTTDAAGRFSIRAFNGRSYLARAFNSADRFAPSAEVPVGDPGPVRLVIERSPPAPDRARER